MRLYGMAKAGWVVQLSLVPSLSLAGVVVRWLNERNTIGFV